MEFQIFAQKNLSEYIDSARAQIKNYIERDAEEYLLNVNENDYVKYLTDKCEIELIEIDFDSMHVSNYESMIPAELFPRSFNVYPGKKYKMNVIKYHLPFCGNENLLHCLPSSRILWSIPVTIENNCICFKIINLNNKPDEIKQRADENTMHIKRQLSNVISEVSAYNSSVENQVRQLFRARKERILSNNNLLASLGVPIKKATDTPSTFSIPDIKKKSKLKILRPEVNEEGFHPEPTLDEGAYNDILRIINDVGREFERLPSLYKDKEEEHLRDHFLMMLEPNFEGSATGETFNKSGKTDILLRYEGKNVFIAECKFWRGKKSFHKTIDQLLGYLTWRDSKSAIILFVSNKDFTSVISTVKDCIIEHTNYIGFVNASDDTWLNYSFHLPGDRNRLLKLAVMLYHLPK